MKQVSSYTQLSCFFFGLLAFQPSSELSATYHQQTNNPTSTHPSYINIKRMKGLLEANQRSLKEGLYREERRCQELIDKVELLLAYPEEEVDLTTPDPLECQQLSRGAGQLKPQQPLPLAKDKRSDTKRSSSIALENKKALKPIYQEDREEKTEPVQPPSFVKQNNQILININLYLKKHAQEIRANEPDLGFESEELDKARLQSLIEPIFLFCMKNAHTGAGLCIYAKGSKGFYKNTMEVDTKNSIFLFSSARIPFQKIPKQAFYSSEEGTENVITTIEEVENIISGQPTKKDIVQPGFTLRFSSQLLRNSFMFKFLCETSLRTLNKFIEFVEEKKKEEEKEQEKLKKKLDTCEKERLDNMKPEEVEEQLYEDE